MRDCRRPRRNASDATDSTLNSRNWSGTDRDHAEQREHPDGQRADAEEDDEETAWRGEFSHDQHETGSEPHPPFHMHGII